MKESIIPTKTKRGIVVNFGKVKVPRIPLLLNYYIPLLTFIVIKKNDGRYVSTCIDLQLDGYGKDVEYAKYDMVENILLFLIENFNNPKCKESAWDNLYNLSESNKNSDILWNAYRACELAVARKGIAPDWDYILSEKIRILQEKTDKLDINTELLETNQPTIREIVPKEIIKNMVVCAQEYQTVAA